MKTIQQCFIDADVEEIISRYIYTYPIEIKNLQDINTNSTLNQVYTSYHDKIYSLIHKIQTCNLEALDEIWIFFAHHTANSENEIEFALVKKSDLLNSDVMSYAYEFSPISETAGFLVADTYLTQYYLKDLLVEYLFESSFFGFEQENLEKERQRLYDNSKYVNEHFDELLQNSKDAESIEFDFELEKRDEEEIEAWKSYISYEIEYNNIAFEIEEQKVIKLLEG